MQKGGMIITSDTAAVCAGIRLSMTSSIDVSNFEKFMVMFEKARIDVLAKSTDVKAGQQRGKLLENG